MLEIDLVEPLYVTALFVCYLALWSTKRRRQRRQTGHDPDVMSKATDRLQQYLYRVTKLLTGFLVLLIAVHAIGLEDAWALRRLRILDSRWADHLGLAVGASGLLLCWIAQATMGASWRVGIDEGQKVELVTTGIFGYIRNPTYLGLFLLNGGLWLIWPTSAVASFVLLFAFFIEVQVRCEEEHLLRVHGDAYRRYLAGTKRYLPGMY